MDRGGKAPSTTAQAIQILAPLRPYAASAEASVEAFLAAERHQLPLFIPVALGAGVAAYFVLGGPEDWIAALALAAMVGAGGLAASGLIRAVFASAALLFAAGLGLAWWEAERVRAPVLQQARVLTTFDARVVSVERRPAEARYRLILAPLESLPPAMRIRVSVRAEPDPRIDTGSKVRLRASLTPPPGPVVPGGYHFARRAWFDGIGATGFAYGPPELIEAPPETGRLGGGIDRLRAVLTAALQTGVGGREGGVAAALVTGDRGGIDTATTEAMRDSGLAHLIAISGLHIAVVVGGIFWIVRRLLVLWEWFALRHDARIFAAAAAALAGIVYTLIAGASVPTVRACVAVLLVLAGLAAGREAISLRLVAAGATFILVWQPHLLLSPSFQLSFAAVTAIVALYQSPWGQRWRAPTGSRSLAEKLIRGAAALIMTGVVAEIALAPIAIFHFNQMGLYGAAANLIAIPLTSFVIIPLLLGAVLMLPLGLAAPFYALLSLAVGGLISLAETAAAMPGAVATAPAMPVLAFGLIVSGGLWFCLWAGKVRLFGLALFANGWVAVFLMPRPDILVAPGGRHAAILEEDRTIFLRAGTDGFVREMWNNSAGQKPGAEMAGEGSADCSPDACVASVERGGRIWTLLATRSDNLIARESLAPACKSADIIVSDRRLPGWCRARWLKLDRTSLAVAGAVSIDLDRGIARTAADDDGAHPWARRFHRAQ